jgi:hypothetical protein
MFRFRRNKNELIVLTGAVYSFVAYLTAFTLEILFIIDLTRRSSEILSAASTGSSSNSQHSSTAATPFAGAAVAASHDQGSATAAASPGPQLTSINDDLFLRNTGLERFKFESIQAHITVSCLAISILYFVLFITSLVLIVALILRSTFMLLIWICAMITMYLPEFCLVAYVSIYCWGPDTRNGQTEIIFYLFRAILNAIFIFRAHKLFKQLNYEKNFFRLKSGGRTSVSSQFAGYDSPYFVGDSLTTTINPVFNSSTLNLNRYDYIRDHHFQPYGGRAGHSPAATNSSVLDNEIGDRRSETGSSTTPSAEERNASSSAATRAKTTTTRGGGPPPQTATNGRRDRISVIGDGSSTRLGPVQPALFGHRNNYSNNLSQMPAAGKQMMDKFYLDETACSVQLGHRQQRHTSMLSINDDLDECELDLDYRTLGRHSRQAPRDADQQHRWQLPCSHEDPLDHTHDHSGCDHDMHHHHHHHHHHHRHNDHNRRHRPHEYSISRSQENLPTFSTQSLDRRRHKDAAFTDQVILRPLGHQPFEYLHRPGSTSNLDHLNTDPNAPNTRHHRRDRGGGV